MGVGVAGLQAIATARRLGAIVTATDVRPATKEQVESLGAKFVAVEDEEFKQAETAGGYAKEMSDAYKAKQAALVASHIAKQDIVITTALIPGRPAPRLITAEMVAVDARRARSSSISRSSAAEIANSPRPGEDDRPTTASRSSAIPTSPGSPRPPRRFTRATSTPCRDAVDKKKKSLAVNWDDELVKATLPHPGRRGRPSELPAPNRMPPDRAA